MLLDAVRHSPGLDLRELYQLYPDFYIDVAQEQKILAHSSAIILYCPLQWGLPPALLVQYLHKVFHYGWAYGKDAAAEPVSALYGKKFLLVTHVVASRQDQDSGSEQSMLTAMQQLALCCGLQWQRPLLLPPLTDELVAVQAAELFRKQLDMLFLAAEKSGSDDAS